MAFNHTKKILVVLGAAGLIGLSTLSPLRGQSAPGGSEMIVMLLQQILQKVNDLPTFIDDWRHTDDSDPSAAMQANFQQLGQLIPQNIDTHASLQSILNTFLLGNNGQNVIDINESGAASNSKLPSAKNFPYANDLAYSTLLGTPIIAKDVRENADAALNYVLNASGANIYHPMPGGGWGGTKESIIRYQGYYNTVMAATSYNNYLLSGLYSDKNQFTALQKTLIQQASDPTKWFMEVGKEKIGFVMRQLLMYESQIFVLMTEMIQLQKQMVSAQAMNTATLIAVNQLNEASMVNFAAKENTI
jgi:hypothetical protein